MSQSCASSGIAVRGERYDPDPPTVPVTVVDFASSPDSLLPSIDQQVRDLQDSGGEPRAIVLGPAAYEDLKTAVAQRFGRERADLEQYQWLPIVVDPFRADRVCVVPAPRDMSAGVRAERLDD